MTKIDKIDLANILLIKKQLKLKNINSVKIKKGAYEIELGSENNSISQNILSPSEKKDLPKINKETEISSDKPENIIKSPMVGVAYLSSDPSTAPYVKVGQHVKQGETLLLIEAMKTFNEIKAPKSGVVKKIIVLNSQPVEFGDELIIFE